MSPARTVLAIALAALAAGCGRPRPVLHVFTWADYIKPELVRRFEREHGCRVVIDTFDSNEALHAKLQAGARGYDVLTPSSYMAAVLRRQGRLRDLDHARLPNLRHVDPDHLRRAPDSEMVYSVPYMITATGIGWLAHRVPDAEPSWTLFDRSDLRGRMTLLNDMRETLGAALKLLGHSLNSTNEAELAAAADVVLRWKRNIAKFENEQYKSGLASEEFFVVHGYSGDIVQAMESNANIVFAVPREGAPMSCDDLVIPVDAPNPELAHAFINFLHDPAVAAENTEFIGYLCPNKDALPLLSEDTRSNPAIVVPAEVRDRCEFIADLGPALSLWTRAWDRIKGGQ